MNINTENGERQLDDFNSLSVEITQLIDIVPATYVGQMPSQEKINEYCGVLEYANKLKYSEAINTQFNNLPTEDITEIRKYWHVLLGNLWNVYYKVTISAHNSDTMLLPTEIINNPTKEDYSKYPQLAIKDAIQFYKQFLLNEDV